MYYATAAEMAKLDSLAVENGLQVRQMMELAGWHMLGVFERMGFDNSKKVVVVCGKGNQAGDGLCAARHLTNYGFNVSVVLMEREMKPDSVHHLNLLKKIHVPVYYLSESEHFIEQADVIIDALIGYSLHGSLVDEYIVMIEQINKSKAKVISYDIPTGVNTDNGEVKDISVQADATLTLALPKKMMENESMAQKLCGRLFLADVGIPAFAYNMISENSRPGFGGRGLIDL